SRPVVRVIVTGHHNGGFQSPRKVPETRQGFAISVQETNQVDKEPLLFVGLRDVNLGQVDIIRLRSAEEQIVGPNGREPVSFLSTPRWISLARVDNRPCKVIR